MVRYLHPGFDTSCDCIYCGSNSTWKQEFHIGRDIVIVKLCKNHHYILRTKVRKDIMLDENVLVWLLIQPSEIHRVRKYCQYNPINVATNRKITKRIWKNIINF